MEAADEPLFQEVLSEVSCKSSNPLTLALFAERVELESEDPKCCKGGRRTLDDGNKNTICLPFDKIVGCHVLNSSMTISDGAGSERKSSNLGIYAFQEHFVNVNHERGKWRMRKERVSYIRKFSFSDQGQIGPSFLWHWRFSEGNQLAQQDQTSNSAMGRTKGVRFDRTPFTGMVVMLILIFVAFPSLEVNGGY